MLILDLNDWLADPALNLLSATVGAWIFLLVLVLSYIYMKVWEIDTHKKVRPGVVAGIAIGSLFLGILTFLITNYWMKN